jgi:lipid-binding SYLF domain-containing protein
MTTHYERKNKNLKENMTENQTTTTNENLRKDTTTQQEKRNLNENLMPENKTHQEKKNLTSENMTQKEKLRETKPSQTSLNPENQDYWYYCTHSDTCESCEYDKDKFGFDKHKSHAKKMDTLICNSYEMLHEYFDLKYQLPLDLFQRCKGILFLRIWKGGLFLGGITGTGIVMARHNQKWSTPCAVSIGGLQIGFQVGIERVDDILLLHDDAALKLFIENGHFRLGVDASLAVGTYGRDSNMGVVMSEGGESKSIYSYSFAKGAFVGITLDGGTLSIDDKVNEEYYGRPIGVRDIFYGDIPIPQHNHEFIKMQELLNSYSSKKNVNEPANVQNVAKPEIH